MEYLKEIYHYGMPRRSGRYPWGSGERPYQNSGIKYKEDSGKYLAINTKGNTVSSLNTYRWDDIKDFDWVLLADIDTVPEYRNRGLASKLIKNALDGIGKDVTINGAYLSVKADNKNAISIYEKLGFTKVKSYSSDDELFIIYKNGIEDISQLLKMSFS